MYTESFKTTFVYIYLKGIFKNRVWNKNKQILIKIVFAKENSETILNGHLEQSTQKLSIFNDHFNKRYFPQESHCENALARNTPLAKRPWPLACFLGAQLCPFGIDIRSIWEGSLCPPLDSPDHCHKQYYHLFIFCS